MKLLLDLGNTRLKWCTLDHDRLGPTTALALEAADFGARLNAELDAMPPIDDVVLAASTPTTRRQWLLDHLPTTLPAARLLGPAHPTPALQLAYAQPATLGVDRWLCLLAAADAPTLLVCCGTALTIDLIGAGGRHHGGLIAASPTLARAALLQRAPHLPADDGAIVDFADNTVDAIASGSLLAAAALVERQYARAVDRVDASPRLWLTGGGGDDLAVALRLPFDRRPQLLFEGMRTLLR